ncbi:MAG: NAD(P)H-hydrate dehydratase [Azoarcus sp.]|jgi:hydroxyethylthiazole kinase-like uncharacterized protein yjeF|nr:NAD(P)H-hydrate dehydratase [Azoarcus sp.]
MSSLSVLPVHTVRDIREIERQCLPGAQPPLMERAGRAAARDAACLIESRPGPVLVACGPGNNGGDGFVLARELLRRGREAVVAFAGDPARLPEDAARAHASFLHAGGKTCADLPPAPESGWALAVDALFGIGLQRPIAGQYHDWIGALNTLSAPRLAVDMPSGLDADTGRAPGVCFRATHTTTFIALKPGLLTCDGPDYCGEISLQPIGIDPSAHVAAAGWRVAPEIFSAWLVPRPRNAHKGMYGDAGVLGGDIGMTGAALLAARAALLLGAGRVYAGILDPGAPACDPAHPELMLRPAGQLPARLDALAAGPGLGTGTRVRQLLQEAIGRDIPLLLDADALNIISRDPALAEALAARRAATVLTPHPAEAGRLLAVPTDEIQSDRRAAALELARRYRARVVLKGCGSLIATPEGRWYINTTGHSGMASAGMGDVLSGLILALLAQGWPADMALIAGVHLHGAAADRLAHAGIGPVGLSAGETITAAREVFNDWLRGDLGVLQGRPAGGGARASGIPDPRFPGPDPQ